ncbi:MAG: protein-glutamate O-methyltransferase CheR [Alphaproteobacteria bacterium]|nr:protein-glutamate O-methyltransferase CheR [Alphaproteobacteria bacterium]
MELSDASARILAALLEARTGQRLAVSRRWRIESALQPFIRDHGSVDRLVAAVASDRPAGLADAVVEALLNNETFFYRDRPAFDLLLGPALSRLERLRAGTKRLRIWCAGCSTGQEAYSIAMRFAEQKPRWQGWTVDIVATDVSRGVIERARQGRYTQFEVQRGLGVGQMLRWFDEKEGQAWQLADEVRRMVRFEVRSLLDLAPPPASFDIILCRNVLLYFCADRRRTVFARLAAAATPEAVLMLGAGETVIGQTDAFAVDPECRGLYLRAAAAAPVRLAAAS